MENLKWSWSGIDINKYLDVHIKYCEIKIERFTENKIRTSESSWIR